MDLLLRIRIATDVLVLEHGSDHINAFVTGVDGSEFELIERSRNWSDRLVSVFALHQ